MLNELQTERAHRIKLALIVVVGGVLRMYQLDAHSLWFDELASVELASHPPSLLWSDWMVREANPPLYYTLLHYWMRAFGDSETAVRFPSALLGSWVPLLVYVLGRRMASARVGLIAAAVAALSSAQIEYSREARGYMLATLAALGVALALTRLTDRLTTPRTPRGRFEEAAPWGLYVASCLVGLYSHTTLVVLPLLASVYFVWLWASRSPREPDVAVRWILANGLCFLAWLWWGWITLKQMDVPQPNYGWIVRPDLREAVRMTASVFFPSRLGPAFYPVCLGLLTATILGLRRLPAERALLLVVFGFGGPLLFGIISLWVPVLLPRTVLWAQFAVVLALATGLAALPGRWRAATLTLVMALLFVDSFVSQRRGKEPWREFISALQRHMGPRDLLLFTKDAHGAHLQHYCRGPACQLQVMQVRVPGVDYDHWAEGFYQGPRVHPEDLASVLAGHDKVYTLSRYQDDPSSVVEPLAREESANHLELPFSQILRVRVWRVSPPGKEAPPAAAPPRVNEPGNLPDTP